MGQHLDCLFFSLQLHCLQRVYRLSFDCVHLSLLHNFAQGLVVTGGFLEHGIDLIGELFSQLQISLLALVLKQFVVSGGGHGRCVVRETHLGVRI